MPATDGDADTPKLFKLWNKMSFCVIDAEHAKSRLKQNIQDEQIDAQPSPCRGMYRKITDLIEDSYYAYKSSKESQNRKLFPTSQEKYK